MTEQEELAGYREKIQEAKSKISQLEGRKEATMERLKTDYNLTSTKKAEAHLDELKEEKKKLDDRLNEVMDQIRDKVREW